MPVPHFLKLGVWLRETRTRLDGCASLQLLMRPFVHPVTFGDALGAAFALAWTFFDAFFFSGCFFDAFSFSKDL